MRSLISTNISCQIPWRLILAGSLICFGFLMPAFSQSSDNDSLIPGRRNDDQPKSVKEYLARQRAAKEKKDHEELLKRGDEVAAITSQLEAAFEKSNGLSQADRGKLASLEKLVTRIRKGLGGDDDDGDDAVEGNSESPSTLKEAFDSLKETTSKLVDELKKTTRFTVSAVAIQSSNSVLKIVRFLRLRR